MRSYLLSFHRENRLKLAVTFLSSHTRKFSAASKTSRLPPDAPKSRSSADRKCLFQPQGLLPAALSIVWRDLCTSDWRGFPPATANQRAASKEGTQWGLSSFSGWHLAPTVCQVLMPPLRWAAHLSRNWGWELSPRPPTSKGGGGDSSALLPALLLSTTVRFPSRVPHSHIWRGS